MASGPQDPDRPGDDDESSEGGPPAYPSAPRPESANPPYAPLHDPEPSPGDRGFGPQAPASWDTPGEQPPAGPQAPAPSGPGPQSPAGSPPAPVPAPPAGPQAPPPGWPSGGPPQAPPEGPVYGGPVPPGGWQAPIQTGGGWAGQPLASWWSRVGAQLLDWLILTVPMAILGGIVAAIFIAGSNAGGVVVAIVVSLLYLVVTLVYAPVLMARQGPRNGQTWGKQIVGITVVRNGGEPVGFGFAALRQVVVIGLLFGWVGSFFLSIPTIVNYLWPLWDDQNRCLHDMVVSTHVVRR